ncbi:uncharacterized protein CIMG_12807 [Coccidioides immitis RS]|uniref:Uncharacterized protein n=1 Tax=Coccidioides immitis (strain RS) TaxID=246410 RepID=A0A0D8JSG9_COCIM|nr:uncharacterized protein CIMG_12807 [Coccidioides immitis RS]KJF60222.1 hypothetical protein CIMG_12807 [Coccidioides immitis RS]
MALERNASLDPSLPVGSALHVGNPALAPAWAFSLWHPEKPTNATCSPYGTGQFRIRVSQRPICRSKPGFTSAGWRGGTAQKGKVLAVVRHYCQCDPPVPVEGPEMTGCNAVEIGNGQHLWIEPELQTTNSPMELVNIEHQKMMGKGNQSRTKYHHQLKVEKKARAGICSAAAAPLHVKLRVGGQEEGMQRQVRESGEKREENRDDGGKVVKRWEEGTLYSCESSDMRLTRFGRR